MRWFTYAYNCPYITVCLRQHKNLKALGLVKPKLSHFYKSHQKQKCHDKKIILNVNLNAS